MTNFQSYPNEITVLQFTETDERVRIGTFSTDQTDRRLSKLTVALYVSGTYGALSTAKIVIGTTGDGDLITSNEVKLQDVGNGFLGRVRFDLPSRFPLTTSTNYYIDVELSGYTPDRDPTTNATFVAALKNSPSTFTYEGSTGIISSTCAVDFFIEE